MSSCCSKHSKKGNMNKADMKKDMMPKSFLGRYLYKLGKADFEKGNRKKGCC